MEDYQMGRSNGIACHHLCGRVAKDLAMENPGVSRLLVVKRRGTVDCLWGNLEIVRAQMSQLCLAMHGGSTGWQEGQSAC